MKTLFLMAIMQTASWLYCQSPKEIVDETIKNLNYTKANKDIISAAEKDPEFYTLKDTVKIKIDEIETTSKDYSFITSKASEGLADTIVSIEKIVNIAEKMWNMVVSNKPAVNVESKYAVALPKGVSDAVELSGWSKPKTYLISFYFENLYGVDVINVSYKVTYVYGGNYNGKGKYLAAVWAIPVSIDAMWGFSFNMSASVPDSTVVNVGSSANPIAALQLKVSWSAKSVLKEVDGTAVYYIQGDGYFEEIASPFKLQKTNLENLKNINLN
ncbi:MAG: hypothetical protein K6357_00240 [Elusimicrobiota bacterium]